MAQTINIAFPATTVAGTVNAITATYTPTLTVLSDKQTISFKATGANTGAVTFSPDALAVKPITKKGGTALIAGDIAAAGMICFVQYDATNNRWELINPASDEGTELTATIQTFNATIATLQTIAVPTDSVVLVETKVICRKSAGGGVGSNGDGNTYVRIAKAKNIGGVVTLQTVQASFTAEDFSTHNATFDVSGTDLRVRVTGTASNTIDWKCFTTIKTLS